MTITGDPTADFLLRQLKFLSRVGSPEQRTQVQKWETVVRTHAEPVAEDAVLAVNFATEKAGTGECGNQETSRKPEDRK